MMLPEDEFRLLIKAAIRKYLDRLADKIDRHYARLGIPKRKIEKDLKKITRTSTGKRRPEMEQKTCRTCVFMELRKGRLWCCHYKSTLLVMIDTPDSPTTCDRHRTEVERAAEQLIFASVDDAAASIKTECRIDVLRLALALETISDKGGKRKSLMQKLQSRIKKLSK